jgi:hypothetical protein
MWAIFSRRVRTSGTRSRPMVLPSSPGGWWRSCSGRRMRARAMNPRTQRVWMVLFTATLHHAAIPAEGAVCAKSFSDPPTKNQGAGTAGSGCLRLGTGGRRLGLERGDGRSGCHRRSEQREGCEVDRFQENRCCRSFGNLGRKRAIDLSTGRTGPGGFSKHLHGKRFFRPAERIRFKPVHP